MLIPLTRSDWGDLLQTDPQVNLTIRHLRLECTQSALGRSWSVLNSLVASEADR